MSTFSGIVEEFPDIRIDHFRVSPRSIRPAACFLSHVHSDHLEGLETLRMPFVYCSSATRSLLLNMEKYPHRINFAKGILEIRKQTYKHLKFILRPLPLRTAIELELNPKSKIQVTLFDANHCPGSVMFLIQGDGKAILYTGDVRAEPWWVNSIAREPLMLPFTSGYKRLDCLYLDTTFASCEDIHEHFPTKAEGLQELLQKLSKISSNSIIYFRAWTLGYEEVWVLISNILATQIHVDPYQLRLFKAIAQVNNNDTAIAQLVGFQVGNQSQPGCLTTDDTVRVHSCEPGTTCHASLRSKGNVVWLTPIISRLRNGTEILEVGAGGAGGDLYQKPKLEMSDETALLAFEHAIKDIITDPSSRNRFSEAFKAARNSGELSFDLEDLQTNAAGDVTISDLARRVLEKHKHNKDGIGSVRLHDGQTRQSQDQIIHFPYSRHSSYSELCHLVSILKPKDICPCTIDLSTWHEGLSMQALFGRLCSGNHFRHDEITRNEAIALQQTDCESSTWDSQKTDLSLRQKRDDNSQHDCGDEEMVNVVQMHEDVIPALDSMNKTQPAVSKDGTTVNVENSSPKDQQLYNASGIITTELRDEELIYETYLTDQRNRSLHVRGILDSDDDENISHDQFNHPDRKRSMAFEAALQCLDERDVSAWNSLHIRSIGWKGHSEEEIEL